MPITYEIKKEEFITSQGLDAYDYTTSKVDAILQTENRTSVALENLDKAIIELQNLLNSQSDEKSDGFEQLKSKSSRLGKAIFNTLFFDEYRQQLIDQANQRRK